MVCRFRRGSLTKLAEFLVAEGVVDDMSDEGLRVLLRKEEVSFQAVEDLEAVTTDPDYEVKKNRAWSCTTSPKARRSLGRG